MRNFSHINLGLGTFRFFLAFLVAISHLWENMLQGPAAYSVWGFFVLSGFLMTLILTKKYGLTREGIKQYAFNRFIRIYPSYLLCCLFGVIVLLACQIQYPAVNTQILNHEFHFPTNFNSYLMNIFMAPLGASGLFVPVAGALFVEVWAYMLMPFAAKHKSSAWLGLIICMFANYHYGFQSASFPLRYSLFATSLIGFFVGALCLHYLDVLKKYAYPKLSLTLWCAHACLWLVNVTYPWTYGIYVSLFFSGWVVISLFPVKTSTCDKLLGDMSYLVYLLHTTVGMCFFYYFGERSFIFFLCAFVVTCLVSYLVIEFYERPIQRKFKINVKLRE